MCKILANMTQVSDVAPGSLVDVGIQDLMMDIECRFYQMPEVLISIT
jgi:hypothetical protein